MLGKKNDKYNFGFFEGLRCTWMGFFFFPVVRMVRDDNVPYPLIYKPMLFIPWEISSFVCFIFYGVEKWIEMHRGLYTQNVKEFPSSVWETWILFKLEKWLCLNFYTRQA